MGKDWGARNLDEILDKRLDRLRTFPGYENFTLEELREKGWAAVPIEYEQYKARPSGGKRPLTLPAERWSFTPTSWKASGLIPCQTTANRRKVR